MGGIADAIRRSKKPRTKPKAKSKPPSRVAWKAEGFGKKKWYTAPDQTITIRIVQVSKRDIKKYCGRGGACHKVIGGVHTIYVTRLMSDDDYINQQKLGHEVHHALGMKH